MDHTLRSENFVYFCKNIRLVDVIAED